MYPKILPYLERISTSSIFLGYDRLEGTVAHRVAPFSGTSRPARGPDNDCSVLHEFSFLTP